MKMKLQVSNELKLKLEQLRDVLGGVDPNYKTDPGPGNSSCGHYCMVTCSWHCENECAGSCSVLNGGSGQQGCAYKYIDPCGYYNTTY